MRDQLQHTIEVLKEKVNKNLEIIKKNQQIIKSLLNQPTSEDRSLKLRQRYALNKSLLLENNDFINVQLTLINFMEKYKTTALLSPEDIKKSEKDLNRFTSIDYFSATINGQLSFDKNHPKFNDEKFFQQLMKYYQEIEDYESCDRLLKQKPLSPQDND